MQEQLCTAPAYQIASSADDDVDVWAVYALAYYLGAGEELHFGNALVELGLVALREVLEPLEVLHEEDLVTVLAAIL